MLNPQGMYLVSQTPSEPIRQILRKEVNFGCPYPGCGSPYLTWHHFDPPWREEHHERPEGIIALCHEHHDHADAGRYTKERLREFKSNPYIKRQKVSEEYDYLRRNTVYCFGNTIGYDVSYVLAIDGEPVIWFERDEAGYDRLNLLIKDTQGNTILYMRNNDWIVFTKGIFDFICTAKGQKLEIISKDEKTKFSIRFDELEIEKFKEKLLDLSHDEESIDLLLSEIEHDMTGVISLWTFKGNLIYKNLELSVDDNGVTLNSPTLKNAVFNCCISVHEEAAFICSTYGGFGFGGSCPPQNPILRVLEMNINELEKIDDAAEVYLKAGQIYIITNRSRLIKEYGDRRNKINTESMGIRKRPDVISHNSNKQC